MAVLLDTSVAIALLDAVKHISDRRRDIVDTPCLSIVTQVELVPGIFVDGRPLDARVRRLTTFLEEVETIPFTVREVEAYESIIAATGFSRRLVIDRMIAATALANDLALATLNPRDFRNIPGLTVEDWSA